MPTIRARLRYLPAALAGIQVLDVVANMLISKGRVDAHLDHLRVPVRIRPLLSPIKLGSSAGLLVGLRVPRLGALTAAGLVAYYSAAMRFHIKAGDHPLLSVPAALLAAGAAATWIGVYLPEILRAGESVPRDRGT